MQCCPGPWISAWEPDTQIERVEHQMAVGHRHNTHLHLEQHGKRICRT